MSESRLNKQQLVNFHPTGSNIVSALNGASWDGSTIKRPVFYFPLQDSQSSVAVGEDIKLTDYSGNRNHGTIGNPTASMSFQHSDTPWGPKYRKGLHKYSFLLGKLGKKGTSGWKHHVKFDMRGDANHLAETKQCFIGLSGTLRFTGSYGAVKTGAPAKVFGQRFTFACWFKPDAKLFEPSENLGAEGPLVALFDISGSERLVFKLENGTICHEINHITSADKDFISETKKTNLLTPGKWHHIAFSRERYPDAGQNLDIGTRAFPRVYLNGKRLEMTGSSQGSSENDQPAKAANFGNGIYLGVHTTPRFLNSQGSTIGHHWNFPGKVVDFIGWNHQLEDREIYAIYGASLGAYKRKSGFIDTIPNRERLYIKDNKTGSYPTIQRSGIDNRHGNYRASFDDSNTIIFKKHKDIFPCEIDKIGKEIQYDDLMGWWRCQELFTPCFSANSSRHEIAQSRWDGVTTLHGKKYNDRSWKILQGINGGDTATRIGRFAYPGTSFCRLSDSGPNALTGTLSGSATMSRAAYLAIPTSSDWGPSPRPQADDLRIMTQDQKSRWGGRNALFFPNSGSDTKASFAEFTEHNKPRMRLVKNLKNGVCRDKSWTMSMWVNLKDKGMDASDSGLDLSGLFRIENTSGSLAEAWIFRNQDTGRFQINFKTYGLNDDDTGLDATPYVRLQSDYLDSSFRNRSSTLLHGSKVITGSDDPNGGMPTGWHHLAFVYRGGKVANSSQTYWRGKISGPKFFTTSLFVPLPTIPPKVSGGRMQIWVDGRQLLTTASIVEGENFKRIREPHQNVAYAKKVVLGHYLAPNWRTTANSSVTGSLSGSITEVALISRALKKRHIRRIMNNATIIPEINVADFPLMLDKNHMHMDRQATSDIRTFGSAAPGIADNRVEFTKGDQLLPFDDRKTLISTGSSLIGTPPYVAPDLDSRLDSKASFTINITPKHDLHLTKFMFTGPKTMTSTTYSTSNTGSHMGRSIVRALARAQNTNNAAGTTTGWPSFTATTIKHSADGGSLSGLLNASRGPIPVGDYTGFVYYNFTEGKWEQIGLYDPASGNRIPFDYAMSTRVQSVMSSTFPQQFKPTGFTLGKEDIGDQDSRINHAYVTAGRPTLSSFAPYATKYHATASQVVKLSDYVTQPFLLERVRVELPVHAFRSFGGDAHFYFTNEKHTGGGAGAFYSNTKRIMHRQQSVEDNLVFFIYRQTVGRKPTLRPPPRSSAHSYLTGSSYAHSSIRDYTHPQIVSGSTRYLIASGVACFYNSERLSSAGTGMTSSNFPDPYRPLHGPGWEYDWGVRMTSIESERDTQILSGTADGVFSGSIILDIIPAIQGPSSLGKIPVFDGDKSYGQTLADGGSTVHTGGPGGKVSRLLANGPYIFNYWPGGTTYKNLFPTKLTGKMNHDGRGGLGNYVTDYSMDFIKNRILGTGNQYILNDSFVADPRTRSPRGDFSVLNGSGTPQHIYQGRDDGAIIESPYLLMPEDELVFGIDYLPQLVKYGMQSNELTGSYVKLLSTGSATVTFYGTFYQSGKPATPTLNQNLTSNAVHEVIGNDPVVDQYQINSRMEYSGSYIDNLMRGAPGGPKGLFHGFPKDGDNKMSGTGKLKHKNNQMSRFRWRQSVVGEDLIKVFSYRDVTVRTGSIYARRAPGKTEDNPNPGASVWYTWMNTPHGGPVWGLKHPTGKFGWMGMARYEFVHMNGMFNGPPDASKTKFSTGSDGRSFYFSLYSNPSAGSLAGTTTQLFENAQALVKPIPASLLRGVRMVTENERYYDSLVPHLGQWAKSHKGHVIYASSHANNGTRRPAFALPGQTSICHTGSLHQAQSTNEEKRPGPITTKAGWSTSADPTTANGRTAGSVYYGGKIENQTFSRSAHRIFRIYDSNDAPSTQKGAMFTIEPVDRATWAKENDTWETADGGDGTSKTPNAVYKTLGWFTHANYIEDRHYYAAAYWSVGAVPDPEINAGSFSGSLSFPYEMSPRRIAGNQRYMMMMFDGQSGAAHSADVGQGGGQPSMFMHNARQLRTALFRIGISNHHHIYSIYPNPSDGADIRYPNIASSSGGSLVFRDGRGIHRGVVQGNDRLDDQVDSNRYHQDSNFGLIHCAAKGHTTGTFCFRKPSKKWVGGGNASGFRYGMINTEPMNSSAVFRHDRYGQFRDMLEQRLYTRFYKKIPTLTARRLFIRLRARSSNSTVTPGPVQIRFKSTISGRRLDPVKTYSQNLSPIATSSLPYFDADRGGKFRNRPYPFDDSVLDSHVIVEEDI